MEVERGRWGGWGEGRCHVAEELDQDVRHLQGMLLPQFRVMVLRIVGILMGGVGGRGPSLPRKGEGGAIWCYKIRI